MSYDINSLCSYPSSPGPSLPKSLSHSFRKAAIVLWDDPPAHAAGSSTWPTLERPTRTVEPPASHRRKIESLRHNYGEYQRCHCHAQSDRPLVILDSKLQDISTHLKVRYATKVIKASTPGQKKRQPLRSVQDEQRACFDRLPQRRVSNTARPRS